MTAGAPTDPFIAMLPADDVSLSRLIAGLEDTVGKAPAEAPLIALAFADSAPSLEAHLRRLRALRAVVEDQAVIRAPQARVVGVTPGFPAVDEATMTEALTDALELVSVNAGITGQVLVTTPTALPDTAD